MKMPNGRRGEAQRRYVPQETQRALQDAALSLLDRDGVLAGLNLQEVADKAGVNRSLVYHHYGSRQQLLRAALRVEAKSFVDEVADDMSRPYPERMARFFWSTVRYARAVTLSALLLFDRDQHVKSMPMRNETWKNIRKGIEDGIVRDDVDIEAFHAALVAGIYGYGLYRRSFSKEMDIPLGQLDERVAAVFDEVVGLITAGGGAPEGKARPAGPSR